MYNVFKPPVSINGRIRRIKTVLLATGLLFGVLTGAQASKPLNVNDGEMALIPPYCPHTMGFKYGDAYSDTSPKAKYWVGVMGPNFWNMHHHCWALIKLRRAVGAKTAGERRALRESAVADILYSIRGGGPNFVLLPELLVILGGAYILLSNVSAAYDAFEQSRQLKPDYWPAYSDWAEVLIKAGQRSQAKALVKTGLENAPESKVLQDQYKLLGGNLADIVPLRKPEAPADLTADSVSVPNLTSTAPMPDDAGPKKP